eukprot:11265513-Alexandrium_andersonii.AAC.1
MHSLRSHSQFRWAVAPCMSGHFLLEGLRRLSIGSSCVASQCRLQANVSTVDRACLSARCNSIHRQSGADEQRCGHLVALFRDALLCLAVSCRKP